MKQNREKFVSFASGLLFAAIISLCMGAYSSHKRSEKYEELGRFQFETNFIGAKSTIYRLDTKYGDLTIYTPQDNFYDAIDFNNDTFERVSLKFKP
ncbi:MAG: hypothetical protein D8M57_14865 [Candidatus Scalindua sp. AMX11]|nr:MAG: hypothetical protein DWQ00_04625 [Candidatus Scalindua sp.]NOG83605.1 hypothetical protein [Planctomycetota bacterium]RZV69643.1 MAG: hypothetical protein EX341_15920 [Candidatus Scalindua sp. SCAELEC01]TDE64092.1 MAG: hypothetical protein D8M57_14865 [Candidatus Scalindua sp. AMX11]